MRARAGALAGLLLLAGCGKGGGSGENQAEAATTVTESVDENLYADTQNRAVPVSVPSPRATDAALPATFQGRWALTATDCEAGRADAKGLMVVEPTTLALDDSRASVSKVTAVGHDRLDVRLAFSGKGQQWTADQTLTLVDGGRTLVRDEATPPTSLRYQRCPG